MGRPDAEELTEKGLKKQRVAPLRTQCGAKGLASSGTKAQLVQRLLSWQSRGGRVVEVDVDGEWFPARDYQAKVCE